MNYSEFDTFMEALYEESKEHSLNGEVSYAYVSGVLSGYLRNAVSDNVHVRDCAIATMKESI